MGILPMFIVLLGGHTQQQRLRETAISEKLIRSILLLIHKISQIYIYRWIQDFMVSVRPRLPRWYTNKATCSMSADENVSQPQTTR